MGNIHDFQALLTIGDFDRTPIVHEGYMIGQSFELFKDHRLKGFL